LRIGHHARVLSTRWKHRLFAGIGHGAEAIYYPDPDPWVSVVPGEDAEQKQEKGNGDPEVKARELQEGPVRNQGQVNDRGHFNPRSYSVSSTNPRELTEIIRNFRARRIEVWILFFPERDDLRRDTPSVAVDCLNETLASAYAPDPPSIIDLRAALDRASFRDSVHLNTNGRAQATRKLAEALRSRKRGQGRP
jgi:hypothetical protein